MVTFEPTTTGSATAPRSAPPPAALLQSMLGPTGRGAVPIRNAFVQSLVPGVDGTRSGPMAKMLTDWPAINAYLLIHALASASAPYIAAYPAKAWVNVAGLTKYAEIDSAKSRWSKQVTKLVELKLIRRDGSGRSVRYTLLHESGNGDPYTRPRNAADGNWFALPHAFWLEGYEQELDVAEKVMLLVALSSKPGFELPANRAPNWYGISESTASRGLRKLAAKAHLVVGEHWVPDARSKTLWRTVRSYTLVGAWSESSRRDAMRTRRSAAFQASIVAASAAAASASVSGGASLGDPALSTKKPVEPATAKTSR